jgi:hypothetical protein
MKPNHAKKAINRPLQTLAISTVISVGAIGVACVPVSAFAAPVISASANAFSVSKLENGTFKITLDLANNQRGKTILVKNSVSLNGKTTVVTLGRFKAGALGKGSLTVSKNIVVGSALVVSSGAKLLIKRRITSIRNLLAIAPVAPSTPVVIYPPIYGAPATPVDPAIARAALRTAILNAAASKADYLLAGGLAEDSVYSNVASAVSAESQVTATIVASTGTLIQATDTLYGTINAANTALLDAIFVFRIYPTVFGDAEPTPAYLALEEVLNNQSPATADLLAKTSAVRALIDAAIAYDAALDTALANAYVAAEAYRQIGTDQTIYSYEHIASALLGSGISLNPLEANTDLLNAITDSLIAEETAAMEIQNEANVVLGTWSRMGLSQTEPRYVALYDAATAFPVDTVLVAAATEELRVLTLGRIASFAALIALQQNAYAASDAYLRVGGPHDSANYVAQGLLLNEQWPDVAALGSATEALNVDTAALVADRVAYLAALAEAANVRSVYENAGGVQTETEYLDLIAAQNSDAQSTSNLVALSAVLRDLLPAVYATGNLTADEIALYEAIGDADAALFSFTSAGGSIQDLTYSELVDALNSSPQVTATISAKTTALIATTATLNSAMAIRNSAASTLIGSLRAYLNSGGSFMDDILISGDLIAFDQTSELSAILGATIATQAATATNVANYGAITLALENAQRSSMEFTSVRGATDSDVYVANSDAQLEMRPVLATLIATTAALDEATAALEADRSASRAAYLLASAASYSFGANGGAYFDQAHQDLLDAMQEMEPVTATIVTRTAALNVATQALIDAQAAADNAIPEAYVAFVAYRLAGGSIDDAVFTALQAALDQDPYVLLDVQEGVAALNAATLSLITAKQGYREAVIDAAIAMQTHTLAGGLAADTAYAALQAIIDANQQVTSTVVAAIATLEAATLALG